jgi:hypothetical protein
MHRNSNQKPKRYRDPSIHQMTSFSDRLTQARSKAAKAVRKASDKESSALKALEKATYEHDVAVAGMHKAETDAKVTLLVVLVDGFLTAIQRTEKQTRDAQRNLEGAKVRADSLAREQQQHKVISLSPM